MTRTAPLRPGPCAGAIALGAVLAASLSGCAAIGELFGGGGPPRDEETGQVTEGSDVDVFELQVGDCLNLGDDGELSTAAVVPCSEPHTEEIFHEFELPDGEWPGGDAIDEAADEGCYAAFETFVGVPREDSVLDYLLLTPLEEGWNDPNVEDRLVQCAIYEPGDERPKELTGSLEGAAR